MSKDIEIKQISWDKELMNSRLEFEISGISHTIINTFRRIILSSIPIYSFNNITISENTSVFNNNYMKLRISNIPVYGIHSDNPIFVPSEKKLDKIVEENDLNDIDINPQDDQINSSSLKLLTMYLDYYNNTDEIITAGTDDCKFYYIEKQIKSPYTKNIPIIKLQPKQKFKMSAITELGIEDNCSIFSPVSIFTYKQISDDKFIVSIESRGQLDEKTIIQYAYDNIKMVLDNFLQLILDIKKFDTSGKIQINDADHTLGNLISEGLQNHKDIKFGGYNCPHLLDKKIFIHYELNDKTSTSIKDIMQEIVEDYQKIFLKINKLIKININ